MTQTQDNQFDLLAPFYDAIYPPEETIQKTINFIEKLTKKENKETKILEVFTRTGKYTLELAKKGFSVKGIDTSQKMIEIAKKNAIKEGIDQKIYQNASIEQEKQSNEKYDLILFLNNAISFVNSPKDLKMVLIHSKHLLKQDGKILIHVVNYKVRRRKKARYYPLREIQEENKNYIIQRFLDFEPKLFFNINIITKKDDKWKYAHKFSFPLASYSLKNLQNHIGASGLHIKNKFGSYDKEKFDENTSKNIILLVSKNLGNKNKS